MKATHKQPLTPCNMFSTFPVCPSISAYLLCFQFYTGRGFAKNLHLAVDFAGIRFANFFGSGFQNFWDGFRQLFDFFIRIGGRF